MVENELSSEFSVNDLSEHEIIDVEVNKSNLETLKESYEVLRKNYSLPEFSLLNEEFSVEKVQSEETDFLIRELRKNISDKLSSYLRFIETLLSPGNAHMFVFSMLKSMSQDDTKLLQEIYKKLAIKEIEVIELDLKYDEYLEAKFINSSMELWLEIRESLLEIISKVKSNWSLDEDNSSLSKNYFG